MRTLPLLLLLAGCTTGGLARTVSTTELGYSAGEVATHAGPVSDPLGFSDGYTAIWVSIRPLAALEPPTAVYSVDEPEEEWLSFQLPVATEGSTEAPGKRAPWWYLALIPLLGGGGWGGWLGFQKWKGNGERRTVRERLQED